MARAGTRHPHPQWVDHSREGDQSLGRPERVPGTLDAAMVTLEPGLVWRLELSVQPRRVATFGAESDRSTQVATCARECTSSLIMMCSV